MPLIATELLFIGDHKEAVAPASTPIRLAHSPCVLLATAGCGNPMSQLSFVLSDEPIVRCYILVAP